LLVDETLKNIDSLTIVDTYQVNSDIESVRFRDPTEVTVDCTDTEDAGVGWQTARICVKDGSIL
jgi:hypothetical protein